MKDTSIQYLAYEDVKVLSKPSMIGVFDRMDKEYLYDFMKQLSVTEVHTEYVLSDNLVRFIPKKPLLF